MSEDLSLFKEFHPAKKTTGERIKREVSRPITAAIVGA